MFLLRSVLVWGGKLDGRKTELLVIHSTSMPKVMLTKCYAQFLFLSVKRPLNICEFYFHPCGIHKKKNDLLVKSKHRVADTIVHTLIPNVSVFCYYKYNNFPSSLVHTFFFRLSIYV